jgi:redox-sensitive bicupin YhaK (pirin superfamily)
MVGDGFRVHNFFPGTKQIGKTRMSPFFMLDYGSKIDFSPKDEPRGVGVHPHAGFETVTIAYQGKVAHHDSAGNSGIIGEGDVQWMTAGAGILHKEYHEEEFSKKGGPFQMVQLWVNLPAKDKKTKPKYQEITNAGTLLAEIQWSLVSSQGFSGIGPHIHAQAAVGVRLPAEVQRTTMAASGMIESLFVTSTNCRGQHCRLV